MIVIDRQSLLRWAPLVLLAYLVFVQPAIPWPHNQYCYDMVRAGQLLLLLLALLAVFFGAGSRVGFSNACAASVFTALLVFTGLSVARADRPDLALREAGVMLALAMLVPVLAYSLLDQTVTRWSVRVIVAGQFLYPTLIIMLVVAAQFLERSVDYWSIFAGYENPRHFNHVQTLMIPLLAGAAGWNELGRFWQRLAKVALAGQFCLLFLLFGRGTGLALAVAASVAAFAFGLPGRRFALRLLATAGVGGVLFVLLAHGLPAWLGLSESLAFRDLGERNSIEARFFLWRIALGHIAAHPWLGIGPMHFAHVNNGEAAHPHNIYLQLAAEWGLPFALIVFAWLARALWRAGQCIRRERIADPVAVGSFAACLAALVDGCFSGNFVMPMPQLCIAFAAALLVSRLRRSPAASPAAPTALHWRLGLALLLALQLGTALQAAKELGRERVNLIGGAANAGDHLSPRFWLDGWF